MAYSMGMQQPLFRFSLIDSVGAQVLTHSPNQWDDQEFSNKRDMQYFGVIRNYVTELEFVLESAKAVRKKLYEDGVDAQLTLRIEKYNKSTRVYFTQYEGDIDFSTVEDERTKIIASLIDGGLNSKIQAYKNISYELPFEDDDIDVNLGPLTLHEWMQVNASGTTEYQTNINDSSFLPATQIANSSISLNNIEPNDQEYVHGVRPSVPLYDFSTSENYLFKSNYFGQMRITGTIKYRVRQVDNLWYEVLFVDSSAPTGPGNVRLLSTNKGNPADVTFEETANIDVVMNVIPTYNYFLTAIRAATPSSGNISPYFFEIIESSLDFRWVDYSDDIIIKAKRPKKVFRELISKMNGVDTSVSSDLLDFWDNLVITSGNGIRNYPDATVKTSFNNFFKSMNAVISAGYSLDDGFPRMETIAHYFDDSILIHDFGEISEFKLSPLTEVMNSAIKVGYEKQDYEAEQGREEFNNGQEYSTPIVRVQTTLDLISEYRADQYGIDQIRIKEIQRLANVNNTDIPSDNDVFLILINKSPDGQGIFHPIGEDYFDQPPSGVSARAFSYNYLLSPKHNLIRNMAFIKSSFYGINDQGSIDFQSADKNADLSVVKDGITISEKANINLADYPDRLFLPFLVEFDTDYKTSIQNMIDMGNRGVIRFSHRGVVIEGFIYSVDISASKNNQTTFTVILSKNNNLQDLIF